GAPVSTDCDDTSAAISPADAEITADGIDQDCDTVDSCYTDADGDNYGTSVVVDGSTLNCTTGTGAPVSTDCDDTSAAISPADAEITADGIDQDCDTVDSCYTDADGDNYGTTVVVDGSSLSCTTGTGAPVSTDCDDASSTDYPGATETVANSDDEDCDGVDSCYTDADGDNHGTTVVVDGSTLNCTTGTGAPASTDCDDSDADTFPGSAALELITSCTNDDDNDGYGDQTVSALYVEGTDCNDASSSISPDDTEVCDNFIDDDCDGGAGGCALSGGNLGGADVKFTGETGSEYAFSWVSGAGDIDDDGYDDVIVGASGNDEGGVDAGAAYLLLGGATPASRSLALADAQYTGEAAGDSAGASASGAGDFNGDGYDDLIINAKSNDDGPGVDAGASYLVLGRATPTSGGLSAATAQYTGEAASDAAGESGAGAGDFNADGYDDLIIGAAANDDGGLSAGAAYLVLGRATPASWGLSSANAQYTGESAGDQAGTAVSGAGDVDADGYDDLIVGANANDDGGANAGAAYLVLGGTTPASLVLASADAQYAGEAAGDFAGGSVSGAGDFNADGYDDLLVGADQNDEGGTRAGAAYLVLGGATPASRSLSSANAQYTGVGGDDNAGTSVSGVGDVDGDSYDDLIIGADGTCAVYLVLGGSVVSSLSLSSADLTYTGESTADLAGSSVSGAGDFDDDGFSDFLIGDWQNGTTGAAYLILGGGL
ncbi:MAG: integrin alpha, partial [Pseudomonadota bacterium]|nr:integrin alpha [Pseudomonadota bacterium]